MPGKEDVTLTFNPMSFMSGLEKITKKMADFSKKVVGSGVNIGKNIGNVIKPIKKQSDEIKKNAEEVSKGTFSALVKFELLKNAISGAFGFLKNNINQFIPEIGQVFGVAKDIVMRNLLFPLRKELVPLLQKMLDWVRENRGLFAKWGAVIANVFRFVKQAFSSVINLMSSFFTSFKSNVENIFGITTKTVSETLNVFIFKLTAMAIFLETTLKPVFQSLGSVFGSLLTAIQTFVKGAITGFNETINASEGVNGLIGQLTETFGMFTSLLKDSMPIIETFGKIFGRVLGLGIQVIISNVNTLLMSLRAVFDLLQKPGNYKNIFKDLGEGVLKEQSKITDTLFKAGKGIFGDLGGLFGFGKTEKVDDAVITDKGIIRTNPNDNIIATQSPITVNRNSYNNGSEESKNMNINFNVGGLNVTVTEGNAQQAGENIMLGMKDRLLNILRNEVMVRGGSPA